MTNATWKLQDAKARFSEVVRRAKSEGPQRVTVHGREEVVVIAAETYFQMEKPQPKELTGQAVIDAFAQLRGLNIERTSVYSPVRNTPDFNDPPENAH